MAGNSVFGLVPGRSHFYLWAFFLGRKTRQEAALRLTV